jgi:hypothetical protein
MKLCVFMFGGANRDRTGDLLVANQALSQLSYGPLLRAPVGRFGGPLAPKTPLQPGGVPPEASSRRVVGLGGVAPPTSPLSGVRSN